MYVNVCDTEKELCPTCVCPPTLPAARSCRPCSPLPLAASGPRSEPSPHKHAKTCGAADDTTPRSRPAHCHVITQPPFCPTWPIAPPGPSPHYDYAQGETTEGYQCLEKAEVVREGKDISIFTYSRMRYVVMQAVAELEKRGYNPEVIDLISLKPFDMETIAKSIRKTRRALIVEECMKTGGIGASLSAVISESLFDELDHQVVRLSSQDVPTAYAYELEAATIVQSHQVVDKVEQICGKRSLVAA